MFSFNRTLESLEKVFRPQNPRLEFKQTSGPCRALQMTPVRKPQLKLPLKLTMEREHMAAVVVWLVALGWADPEM